jgi:hypothetical protein
MSYGITILNSNNLVQIDETYKNHQISSIGILALNGSSGGSITIPKESILLVKPQIYSNTYLFSKTQIVGSNKTITIFSGNWSGGYSITYNSISLDFITTSLITNPITSGYGLNVFNSIGDPVYSSENRVANYVQSTLLDLTTPNSVNITLFQNKFSYINIESFTSLGLAAIPNPGLGNYVISDIIAGIHFSSKILCDYKTLIRGRTFSNSPWVLPLQTTLYANFAEY